MEQAILRPISLLILFMHCKLDFIKSVKLRTQQSNKYILVVTNYVIK